ncbi:MAG: hypothetical protein PHY56_04935, partial [Candidatus Omnitrophica bacterium]|nr:hypothetical protein [Candidatus Omnitrophota bacterium]
MSSEEIKYILSVKDDGTATINKVNSELSSLDDHAKKANTSFSSMTSIMSGLKTAIVGIGLYKLVGELKSLAQEAGAAQKSSAGLTQSMISNGRYSEQLHKKLIDTAKALQQVTTYEDDATIEGQKFLLMYSKISDNLLPRATEAMLDLAAMMGGDLSGAAKLLGKASEGVTSGLSRYGIVIDESTAKSGDFGKILDAVTEKVGGQARALATTGIGQWEQLNNLWGDARENLGDLVLELGEGFLPILRDVVTSINNLVEDKDKISDWATNFQIQLINVEAEVMRLAMLVDKAGGTLTSIGMGAAGITTWTESGKKAFETFAQMNIDLEKNYKKTDKALEELAIKQIALEKQLTSEYKAEMEKRRKAAEEVLEASSTGTKKGGISIADDSFAEALKKIDSVRESWSDTKRSLETDIKLSLFDDSNWGQYQKQLINSQLETDNLKDKNKDLYGSEKEAAYALINQAQAAKDAAAQIKYLSKTQEDLNSLSDKLAEQYLKVSDAYDKAAANLSKENKYTKQAKDAVKAYTDAQKYGIITYNEMIQKIDELNKHYQNLIDNELAEKQEDFYKDLLGYEDEYYEAALKNIEAKRQAEIEAIGDIEAANEKARQRMGELEHNMFTQKTGYISDGLSAMQSAFDEAGMSTQALVIAQKALAVVNAVNAITTQGLGDPYTAFARIAAMIAAMTSLLSSAGISFSGGGGGTASASLPKSTVLGAEAGTGSSSINNSYEMLKDTYSMEYSELSELNASMKALNSNISGLVSNILRYGVGNTESWDLSGLDKTSGIGGFIMDTWKTALTAGTGILPISDSINKLINKATNAVFGGSTLYKIKASGLALGGISVADLMGGEDVSAKAYARIKKTVEGGWFSSDKYSYSTKYASLSSSTTDLISSIYSDISTTLVALTTELGTDMSKTMAYAFKATKLNLKGMTSDEINDTLSEYFSNIGDKAVEKLFGSMLKGYQEVGEGLLETAV